MIEARSILSATFTAVSPSCWRCLRNSGTRFNKPKAGGRSDTPRVYRLVMNLLQRGAGYCVLGNHDDKLLRWLKGERAAALTGRAESVSDSNSEQVSTPSETPRV